MLLETLNELVKATKGKQGHVTLDLLLFHKRITEEIIEASVQHRLSEYLGMIPSNSVSSHPEKRSKLF